MTPEQREAIRQTLVVIDAIVTRAQRRLAKIHTRLTYANRPFSSPKSVTEIKEVQTMLADIPHKKEALLTILKMQEEA